MSHPPRLLPTLRAGRHAAAALAALLALSCGTPDGTPVPNEPDPPPVGTLTETPERERKLTDDQLLTRISLDLRGVRPTLEELARFEQDPSQLDAMVDEFLKDERFLRRLEDVFSEILYTRNGDYYIYFSAYLDPRYGGYTEDQLIAHVGEEPVRMLSYLAENDLPYTEWVTGDWTMADELLADLWPIDRPEGTTGWQKSSYTDDRPGVGVLSVNSMWWFRGSMENNRNRGRANYVSRIFLCDDYLERQVDFTNVPGNSEEALGDAIDHDPACVSCHQSLDPLASHFYGYWWYFHDKGMPEQIEQYHPEREFLWKELTGIAPGYFGKPSTGLVDLGELISTDPRYAKCFVKHAWELTTRTDADLTPPGLEGIEEAFEASGLKIREVFRALVKHEAYQGYDDRFALKMATPELLSSQVTGLTGYEWTDAERDLVTSSNGYVLLAGGHDGDQVTSPPPTANVTTVLVQQRLAENAAAHVVHHDLAIPAGAPGRTLFGDELTFAETPGSDDARVRQQIVELHRKVLGKKVAADGPEVDAVVELWTQAYTLTSSVETSWVAVVGVLLRDPDLVMY